MKKVYLIPEMQVDAFAAEEAVTASAANDSVIVEPTGSGEGVKDAVYDNFFTVQ